MQLRICCNGNIPMSNEAVGSSTWERMLHDKLFKVRKDRKSLAKPSYPWVLHVSRNVQNSMWVVKTYVSTHVCLQSRKIKACTARYLSKQLVDEVRTNPHMPVQSIKENWQKKLELSISKMKAFRAKQLAYKEVMGDYKEQYLTLRAYALELQRTNIGTTTKIEVEACANPSGYTRVFKRMYICLGPLKEGFKRIKRDLLGVDGTFIKGPYLGQLLTAVGVDPNDGIYPLVYALVEAETLSSWKWFLLCLRDDLGLTSMSNFKFVSDRQKVFCCNMV
mgnify:CR=1 FL=1